MPEWLQEAAVPQAPIPPETLALRLVIAAVLGAAVAAIYRLSHGRLAREAGILASTLVLLTILLAMVTMVIGDSVARAFGLVGALSIVRFRTVVDDTRDTAFVIFAVIVGMAAGTGLLPVALIGLPIVGAAAIALSPRRPAAPAAIAGNGSHALTVRLGVGRDLSAIEPVLTRRASAHRLVGVATARQGAALDVAYVLSLAAPGASVPLAAELNALEGVQSVELRET